MKRRNLIINSVATSIGTAVHEGVAAKSADLRQSHVPAHHLGVHMSVWAALVDRASSVLPDIGVALCAERTCTGDYRFLAQEAGEPTQEHSWRLHAASESVLHAASTKAMLLCSSRLASHAWELTVLRVEGVASAGGMALYHCSSNAGPAMLVLPAREIPPKLLGLALNEH